MELNGAPVSPDQLRALALANYGHFTTMLVQDCRVRGLSMHLERLTRDCWQLFERELDTDLVRHQVRHSLSGLAGPTTVRVTVYDSTLDLGTIGSDAAPDILVTARPVRNGVAPPLRLETAQYQRELPTVKHVSIFGALRHRRRAVRAGFDDVLFTSCDGAISEVSTSNIGFVRRGRVIWPQAEWLPGVTMTLIDRALGPVAATAVVNMSDLPDMEAAFVTNSISGVRAVLSVNRTEWCTEHKTLDKIRELYASVPYELL